MTNAPRPHERRLFDAEFASVSVYHGTAAPVRVSSSVVVVGSPPGGPLATMCWTHTIAPSSIIVQLSLTTKVLSPSPVFVAVAVYGPNWSREASALKVPTKGPLIPYLKRNRYGDQILTCNRCWSRYLRPGRAEGCPLNDPLCDRLDCLVNSHAICRSGYGLHGK